jgi:DNA polymerase III subunit delta
LKLRAEQLSAHLAKRLLPIYLAAGSELLLLQDMTAEILQAAKKAGFLEHRIFQIDNQFNWEKFLIDAFTVSMFSSKGIMELRFGSQLPNAAAVKALQMYFDRLPRHKILMLVTEKLDANIQKLAWFKTVDEKGVVIQVWPIDKTKLPAWISDRARQKGLQFDAQALTTLTEFVEGNLLAASQVLDRLQLLNDGSIISCEQILQVTDDQAQFNVFDLIEALLERDLKRAYRVFGVLKDEGVEPLLVLNLLIKEIRLLSALAYRIEQGQLLDNVLQSVYLIAKKQAILRRVLPGFSTQLCQILMQKASLVDQVVKGVRRGDSWQALSEFCLEFYVIPIR